MTAACGHLLAHSSQCKHLRRQANHNAATRRAGSSRHFSSVRAKAQPSPEEMQKQLDAVMKDPEARQRMQAMEEQMKNPAMQQQMAQMQAVMANPEMQQKMAALREDPELKPLFEKAQKGGMQAVMALMNDQQFLQKIGEKMGDIPEVAAPAGAGPAAAGPAAAAPEVNNLLDAAKHGDIEAVEDFIAIGRDVNEKDKDGRTPLHYAVAYQRDNVADELLSQGADLQAQDSQGNTVLHYAAGYGRGRMCQRLVEAGAPGSVKNGEGMTPFDLAKSSVQNPINTMTDVMQLLEDAAKATS